MPGNNNKGGNNLTLFDDKENIMVNKSVVSQNCPLASGVSTDRSVTVAVAAAPMKGENEIAASTGSGVSVVGTNSVTRGCTPTSSSSTPSDFAGTVTQPIGFPQKIDKEYLASINKLPLTQLKLEILKLAKDQYGCRFLQRRLMRVWFPTIKLDWLILKSFSTKFIPMYTN